MVGAVSHKKKKCQQEMNPNPLNYMAAKNIYDGFSLS